MHTTGILLLSAAALASLLLTAAAHGQTDQPATRRLKVAAVVTEYRHNSHADVIVSRLLQTDTLDGKGKTYPMDLVSLYTDQVPPNDTSRQLAQEHHFTIYPTVEETLTLGTGKLAVDAVLLVAEHGKYPARPNGNVQFPKRRLFEEVVKVFKKSGRVVPVFIDKHLGDNWEDINWVYTTAKEMHIPLMAGSSLPVLWRRPPVDVERGAEVKEIVGMSFHTLDAYGFHAMEACQVIAERRKGGETGIKSVRALKGEQVWEEMAKPHYDPKLFAKAWNALPHHANGDKPLREAVKDPTLFIIEHADGLKVYIFTLNGAVSEWSVAWKTGDGQSAATQFYTQEARPFYHFALLDEAAMKMFFTGKPTYPVERTLLTSGALDALLTSRMEGGKEIPTPYLMVPYSTDWSWQEPAPPPPDRPIMAQ